ncbi:MAG: large repetitive protein [Methyloprofundus sp.]|nr:MAG: large repetitive protein [Methyloprofundus sp.]
MKKLFAMVCTSIFLLASTINTQAATIGYADVVLDFYDSGTGPVAGPYGGNISSYPIPVALDVVLGNNENFLSLPAGSYVTVGFTDETIIDGPGDDLFIQEIGAASELADVFISSDLLNYILLGTADGGATTSFDFASIGFSDAVQAVKIVGRDNLGASPGFDVVYVQALPGSIGAPASAGSVPELPAVWLLCFSLLGYFAKGKKKMVI